MKRNQLQWYLGCPTRAHIISFHFDAGYMMHFRSRTPEPYMTDRPKQRLVLSGALGELEVDALAGEALVDLGVGVEAVVNTTALLLVKDDLEDLGAVLLGAETLADNLDGVDEVGEDGVVDSGKSPGLGALLGLRSARAVGALGAGQNAAGSNDQDVAVRELLLELTGETADNVSACVVGARGNLCLPLLGLVPALEKGNGDEDDNRLPAVANLDLRILVSAYCSCPVPTASSIKI
jgi:hypothetical protein